MLFICLFACYFERLSVTCMLLSVFFSLKKL